MHHLKDKLSMVVISNFSRRSCAYAGRPEMLTILQLKAGGNSPTYVNSASQPTIVKTGSTALLVLVVILLNQY